MHFEGILIGVFSFVIIGLFHPIVTKTEFHFGKKVWPLFFVAGLICCVASLLIAQIVVSILLAVLGSTFFYSIRELHEQEERVQKGWYPENPNRK